MSNDAGRPRNTCPTLESVLDRLSRDGVVDGDLRPVVMVAEDGLDLGVGRYVGGEVRTVYRADHAGRVVVTTFKARTTQVWEATGGDVPAGWRGRRAVRSLT